jgi:hypothetical protein
MLSGTLGFPAAGDGAVRSLLDYCALNGESCRLQAVDSLGVKVRNWVVSCRGKGNAEASMGRKKLLSHAFS